MWNVLFALSKVFRSTPEVCHRGFWFSSDLYEIVSKMEKKAKFFDKTVHEWKTKIEGLQTELDTSQAECRSYSTELFKVKATYEESIQQLDGVRKENKVRIV